MKTLCHYILLLTVSLVLGCKKEEPPTIPVVSTTSVSNVTWSTATCGGNITSDGRSAIISHGVCWSTNLKPTTNNLVEVYASSAIGPFTCGIGDLLGATTYHVRAYATNSVGTAYGEDLTFTTLGEAPIATTEPATNIFGTTATLNGVVNANYLSTTVTFEYGKTIEYGSTVTATPGEVAGISSSNVSAAISDLTSNTDYHFRVKAVNILGTVYGYDKSFATSGHLPTATTEPATNISATGATLNGTVNANGLSTTVTFQYDSTIIGYRNSVTASQSPVTGERTLTVSADISGLTSGKPYHFIVLAENSDGHSHGDDMAFTISKCDQIPVVTTLPALNVSDTSSTLNGIVNANGLPTTVTFTLVRGGHGRYFIFTVNAEPGLVTGFTDTSVSASGPGRPTGTRSFCIYTVTATNSCGTVEGSKMSLAGK